MAANICQATTDNLVISMRRQRAPLREATDRQALLKFVNLDHQ